MAVRECIFAFTEPQPEREAIIVYSDADLDICMPITTEAEAYKLAKQVGAFGFWRLKSRKPSG